MSMLNKLRIVFNIDTDVYHNVDKNIKFGFKYGLVLARNLYEFETNTYQRSQMAKVIVMKMMTFITIFRYMFTALIPKKWVIVLMSDAMYLLQYNRSLNYPLTRLASFMFSQFTLVIFSMTSFISLAELESKCPLITFLFKYRENELPSLQPKYSNRLAIYLGIFTKLIYPTFWPLNIISIGLMTGTTVVALLDPDSGFNATSAVFWTLCLITSFIQFYAAVCVLSLYHGQPLTSISSTNSGKSTTNLCSLFA